MGKTNRDRVKGRKLEEDDDGDHALHKESKKKQKRNRRNAEKNLKDAVLSGVYTEEYFDDADLGG